MKPEKGGGISVKLMGDGGGGPRTLWKTPTPYIFLALLFTMVVIAVALLVLIICTRRRASSRRDADETAAAAARELVPLDREPKQQVAVLMPGDHAPSFVASVKPLDGDGPAAA